MNSVAARARIRLIASAAAITRFHNMAMIRRESVGEHTFLVALLVDWLSEGMSEAGRYKLLRAALLHDVAEAAVGDIPSPTKLLLPKVAQQALKDAEYEAMASAHYTVPELTAVEYRVQKMADILAGILTCRRELEMGNTHARFPELNYAQYLEQFEPFTEHERGVLAAVYTHNLQYYAKVMEK
jgi:5'-deoxynucleotidase YfbR-like HD superfamily hydrolase